MIRFLQTEGPIKKIVLSGLLLLICGAMAITLTVGLSSDLNTGGPQPLRLGLTRSHAQ